MPRRATEAPRPTVVLFVRHGTTPTTGKLMPGRAPGLHLSEQGRAEVTRTAERLAALPAGTIGAVHASTLERAQETAGILAEAVGLPVTDEPDLVDNDTGEWTGRELRALYKEPEWRQLERWPGGFRFPGGESIQELRARVVGVVGRLRARHPGAIVLAVSHADPIKIAVADALGSPLDLSDRIVISPASVTTIAYTQTGVSVLGVNSLGAPLPVGAPPKSRNGGRPRRASSPAPAGEAAAGAEAGR